MPREQKSDFEHRSPFIYYINIHSGEGEHTELPVGVKPSNLGKMQMLRYDILNAPNLIFTPCLTQG